MYGRKLKQILEKTSLDESPAVINFWNSYKNLKIPIEDEITNEEEIFQFYTSLSSFIKKKNLFLSKEMIKLYLILWLITFEIIENKNLKQNTKEKYLNKSKIDTKIFIEKFDEKKPSKNLKYFISTKGNINSILQNSIFNLILSLIGMTFFKKNKIIYGGIIFFFMNKITTKVWKKNFKVFLKNIFKIEK